MGTLSKEIAAFIDRSTGIAGATRDASNRPFEHTMFGAKVSPDRSRITVFVALQVSEGLAENLANGGPIAVTFSAEAHKTYQVKGRAVDVHPARADEEVLVQAWMKNVEQDQLNRGAPPQEIAAMQMLKVWPGITVTFEVERLFFQTPGPGAGREIPLEG